MAPFYGWGSTASRLEPLRGGSLLFTTKFPEIPGTHFNDLEKMNDWVNFGAKPHTIYCKEKKSICGTDIRLPCLEECFNNLIKLTKISNLDEKKFRAICFISFHLKHN